MKNSLHTILGVDTSDIPEDAVLELEWHNLPSSWGVFVLLGVVGLLAWLVYQFYRRESNQCSVGIKRFLVCVRLAVLGVLLVIFLDPALSYTRERSLRPTILLLRDASHSMNTKDHYRNPGDARAVGIALNKKAEQVQTERPSRVDLVNHLLEAGDGALLENLKSKGTLVIQDFSDRVTSVELPTAAEGPLTVPRLVAKGQATDLAHAIEDGLSDKMTSGIVVMTDGQHNAPSELRDVARVAKKKGVPLMIVGLGDPDRPRNLSVSDLYSDSQVWANDPFEIQATVQIEGASGETVPVRLLEITTPVEGGKPVQREIARQEIQLPASGGQKRVTFFHTPTVKGRHYYTAEVGTIDNEQDVADNQPANPIEVQVLDEKARVLLVSGLPSWEYRSVSKLLTLDKSINLSCWLQTMDSTRTAEGDTPISHLPATREELFDYDVVMLLDPDPKEFDQAWLALLKDFVKEHAGGLFFMAGPQYASRFIGGSQTGGIAELLPVTFGDLGRMEVTGLLSSHARAWPLGVITANADQPIMKIYANPIQNLQAWQQMPGVYWSFPANYAKPAAQVLLEHSDPSLQEHDSGRPLLVTGHYGSGRVVYQGFIGTWLWRQVGLNAEYFNRYWVQSTRFLVEGRSLAGKRRGVIEADRFQYQIGDQVRLTARRIRDEQFNLVDLPELRAVVDIAGKSRSDLLLQAVPNQPGLYEGSLLVRQPGLHLVQVELEGGAPVTLEASFAASLPNIETRTTWLNKALLKDLAEQSGGQYFDVNQAGAIAEAIPDRTQQIEMQSKPILIWDTNRTLLLLVALLGVEWATRKRFKLI